MRSCLTAILFFIPTLGMAAEPVDFNRDVRLILSDNCFACHGFDAKARKAELRLDTPEGFAKAIKPGDLKASELWARITSNDTEALMPPPHTKKTLTQKQKDTLKAWIEQGAKYSKHWSFEPIARVQPPKLSTSSIDAFLLTKIQASGLKTEPEADKETLIRRVAFALTGLPPTIKEVDAYLADKTAKAYENMVDRYLASERYGEEMGRNWLDVARYADTHGLHLDNERQMWAYRDWVVKAFNQNLSYDKFTVWQLAGDLLPNPTQDQLLATGFNRCNVTTSEGGSIASEFEYRYAVERTTATAQAWLGLTAGCAVCHDHKFDPLTQKEFYAMYAFFRSAADPAMDGNINVTQPFMKMPRPELKELAEVAGKHENEARSKLMELVKTLKYIDPTGTKAERKAIREVLLDEALPIGTTSKTTTRNGIEWDYAPSFPAASGKRSLRLAHAIGGSVTIDYKLRPIVVPHDGVIEVAVHVDYLDVPSSVTITFNPNKKAVSWTRAKTGMTRNGAKSDKPEIVPGKWNKLKINASEIGLKPGDSIGSIVFDQRGGVVHFDDLAISGDCDPATDPLESLTAWKKAMGKGGVTDMPGDITAALAKAKPDAKDEEKIQAYYCAMINRHSNNHIKEAQQTWLKLRGERIVAEEEAPGSFIFRDQAKPVDAFVMMRGQYDKPGDKVEPAGPKILPPIKPSEPGKRLNRLDLANWLVSRENPLTARVTVNRLWQQFFGTGLVKTSYDFGTQGEPPSHPELLDWLATEFVAQKWDVKAFVKMMVMTDAFKRSGKMSAEVQVKDPTNRLYAHGPRYRLDAEQIRDNALAVSGLMDYTIGGKGVKPYQPANIWEPIGYGDSNTRYYQQDHGSSLYRRSMYTFLKRTAPPPFMSNFDGPNREQVCLVRERSNTPIQALQLMNDVQFFEASRALAERALIEGGKTNEDKIVYMYRTVLSRKPDADELKIVTNALEKQRSFYKAIPEAAKKVVETGESKPKRPAADIEIAAWTMIANLMLNLDETVNK